MPRMIGFTFSTAPRYRLELHPRYLLELTPHGAALDALARLPRPSHEQGS